jgi:hypothetical protein
MEVTFKRYEPRSLRFLGVETVGGQRLKVYSIVRGDDVFDRERFAAGWALAEDALPLPAMLEGRPGVGFAILHQGATGDYLIVGWWDRENELPTRVFIRDTNIWRPAAGGESFCVWDLRVMWWEREAYVNSMLAGRPDALNAYVANTAEGFV